MRARSPSAASGQRATTRRRSRAPTLPKPEAAWRAAGLSIVPQPAARRRRQPRARLRRARGPPREWRPPHEAWRVRAQRSRQRSWDWPTGDCVREQIHTHAKRSLVQRRRILVYLRVLPAIAEVAFVIVEHRKAVANEDPEPSSRLAVVLVDLWQAPGEVVYQVIHRMRERHVDER